MGHHLVCEYIPQAMPIYVTDATETNNELLEGSFFVFVALPAVFFSLFSGCSLK
jgi:hypothetical protein